MAYIHTGYYRRTIFRVDKKDGTGSSVAGYPVTYNFLNAFGAFDLITSDDLGLMSEEAYQERLAAFYTYVEASEAFVGFDAEASIINDLGPNGYDADTCIPGSAHIIK